jgi:hypothetical protein
VTSRPVASTVAPGNNAIKAPIAMIDLTIHTSWKTPVLSANFS